MGPAAYMGEWDSRSDGVAILHEGTAQTMTKVTNTTHARTLLQVMAFLRQAGWNIPDHQVLLADEPMGATVYLYDAESGYRHFSIYSRDALSSIRQHAGAIGITPQDSGEQLISVVDELIGGEQTTMQGPTSEQRTRLHIATGLFVRRTYASVGHSEVPAHSVILQYRNAQTESYVLRLSEVMTDTVLTPEEVEHCALRLLALERIRHPERFEKASEDKSSTKDLAANALDASSSNASQPARKPRPRR